LFAIQWLNKTKYKFNPTENRTNELDYSKQFAKFERFSCKICLSWRNLQRNIFRFSLFWFRWHWEWIWLFSLLLSIEFHWISTLKWFPISRNWRENTNNSAKETFGLESEFLFVTHTNNLNITYFHFTFSNSKKNKTRLPTINRSSFGRISNSFLNSSCRWR